jgi:hypothetical protein
VFTTAELQQFTYLQQVKLGRRAVVIGAEHVSFSAAMTLRDAGIACAGIITPFARHQSYPALRLWATRFGRVPLLTQHRVASIEGRGRVEAVILDTPHGQKAIECDTVIVSGDWVAEGSLALKAGLSHEPRNGGRPEVSSEGATATEGIFAAGSLVRPGESAASAARAGAAVAQTVARHLVSDSLNATGLTLGWLSPIRWLSPQWIGTAESTPLRIRVDQWMERPTVIFRSDGRVVDTVKLRRMIPGRTYTINGSWVRRLEENDADIQVSIGMSS